MSLSFLGRELEAGRVTLAAYHKRNGQLLAYQEEQITDGAVAMVVDFDTQEIRAAARDAEGKTIEAQVAVLVETEEGKGVYHSLPLNFYLEPGLIGDEHLPNSARPAWEMMYETVVKKAEETEGYAGSALASKRAAAASEAAAGTSATNAARDAKSAHAAKTAVESLATTWPETVREGKQQIIEARNEAVTAIQDKQADSVLAVGRASQTAQQNIASAQSTAVQAVQTAQTEAVGAVTPLVQRAETAKEAIDQAERRINTAATNATTAATSAASSATAAQQALEAIPEVDASGNMTLAGGLTAAGAINANGGVNIPLAVGAPTDTAAVNRLHAAGLAGVTDIFSQHAYLNTGSITATGTAATTAFIPGQYAQVRVPAGTHSTIVFPFTGPNGQHNYSNFAGFSIPWRILGAGKITIGIGRGSKTTRSDLTQGSYSIIPGNNLAHNSGEILDITFDNVRDATRGGYVVKVREIYALSKAAGWRVKTTTSFVPATHNEPIPSIVNKIIYHQRTQYKFESEYISYGSLYLLTGGGQTVQLHKIAAVRGVNAFETGLGISSIVTDLPGNASGDVYMQAGSAVRTLYQPGNINPVYYALEALARNDIEAEETADFVDINIPL
ncbi:hypothetical protein [Akkermansia muciniphila]|uniref:hypothetical protein n=1 Tax=Akkermansia muciniphila TaxID=239935 RepID=UPI0015E15795|nr:hypothetical protein [Akkermansia muciniphila]MBS5974980.1 hypothetical protein [Akkermansia muciniphila]QWP51325.1 hypothetical protein J5W58_00520 [Akkermansia muciniphila]